jgi:hypothetical protein
VYQDSRGRCRYDYRWHDKLNVVDDIVLFVRDVLLPTCLSLVLSC